MQLYTTKKITANLLSVNKPLPRGCFLEDGKLIPGFGYSNTGDRSFDEIKLLKVSDEGGGALAYFTGYTGTAPDIWSASEIDGDEEFTATYPSAFEARVGERGELVLFGDNSFVCMRGGSRFKGALTVTLCCAVMRNGRVFGGDASERYKLRFSGVEDYSDWAEKPDGAGYVCLDPAGGKILKVFDMEDRLIILREYGVTRFYTSGSAENFKVEQTVFVPAVMGETAQVAGDTLLFCTEAGLYVYKNGSAKLVECAITDDLTEGVSASVWQQRYYAVCGTSKKRRKKMVYVYDFYGNATQYVEVSAYYISQDLTSLLAYTVNSTYRIKKGSYEFMFETDETDFGYPQKRKFLKYIEADSDGEITVEAECGSDSFTVYGRGKITLNRACNSVKFIIYGSSEIRSVKLHAEVRDDV